jgi:hypothetical protein
MRCGALERHPAAHGVDVRRRSRVGSVTRRCRYCRSLARALPASGRRRTSAVRHLMGHRSIATTIRTEGHRERTVLPEAATRAEVALGPTNPVLRARSLLHDEAREGPELVGAFT